MFAFLSTSLFLLTSTFGWSLGGLLLSRFRMGAVGLCCWYLLVVVQYGRKIMVNIICMVVVTIVSSVSFIVCNRVPIRKYPDPSVFDGKTT